VSHRSRLGQHQDRSDRVNRRYRRPPPGHVLATQYRYEPNGMVDIDLSTGVSGIDGSRGVTRVVGDA
jgi:hypothetical protein